MLFVGKGCFWCRWGKGLLPGTITKFNGQTPILQALFPSKVDYFSMHSFYLQ